MASHGLVKTAGSGSTGRAPGTSARVKQSCRLAKRCCCASLRSRSVNSRQTAIDNRASSGLRILLKRPIARVSAMRGMRLVSRKFRSSCWKKRRSAPAFTTVSSISVRPLGLH